MLRPRSINIQVMAATNNPEKKLQPLRPHEMSHRATKLTMDKVAFPTLTRAKFERTHYQFIVIGQILKSFLVRHALVNIAKLLMVLI